MSCCPPKTKSCCPPNSKTKSDDKIIEEVKDYYGKVLKSSKDLKTNACTASGKPHPVIQEAISKIPMPVVEKFYGCGSPIPLNIEGLSILDLGSGSGRDCYIAAVLAGPKGKVTGVDMTDDQLQVARDNIAEFTKEMGFPAPTLDFKKGYIEDLASAGIESESVDLVISNCVVNLSPNKEAVIAEAYRVLRDGGELYFSDVYSDRRIPQSLRDDDVLFGECISGALYVHDFKEMAVKAGFDVREVSRSPMVINNDEIRKTVGNINFWSITYRLFKLSGLETRCEDYGQVAVYNGGILGQELKYALDADHVFEHGRPMLVCGNTARMLTHSTLHRGYFTVTGDTKVHYGLFACSKGSDSAGASVPTTGGCC